MSRDNAVTRSVPYNCGGHLQQVKISVAPELALAFKSACASAQVSMASTLARFMADYASISQRNPKAAQDYSVRRKRRVAIKKIINQLGQIRENEERYRDAIPENIQGSSVTDSAEEFISCLDEAISALESIDDV